MLNFYHLMSILMLLEDVFNTFNETQGLNIGFQKYSIWEIIIIIAFGLCYIIRTLIT